MNKKIGSKINHLENIDRSSAGELFKYLTLSREDDLLDLGAGAGYICFPVAEYVKKVIALDIDKDILEYVDRKAKFAGISNIKTLVSDFKDIKLDNESVDKAIASISLHEVKPLSLVLSEIYRVLKNEGFFLCIELEKTDMSNGPRVSLENMKEEILHAGFQVVDVIHPQKKLANQPLYIILAQKNK